VSYGKKNRAVCSGNWEHFNLNYIAYRTFEETSDETHKWVQNFRQLSESYAVMKPKSIITLSCNND
jgi:hypothetical protein